MQKTVFKRPSPQPEAQFSIIKLPYNQYERSYFFPNKKINDTRLALII